MIGLGWSEPRSTLPGACSSDQFGRTRAICAVSPQDDWIEAGCGCRSTGASCMTQENNPGMLFCCPQACPSTAPGGGVSTAQPLIEQLRRDEREKDLQRQAATSPWPWVAVGGVLLLGFGGLAIYSKKKARREKMLLMMQLMENE